MENEIWYRPLLEAVPVRRSVRTFEPGPLPDGTVEEIAQFAKNVSLPFEGGPEFVYFRAEPGKKLYKTA